MKIALLYMLLLIGITFAERAPSFKIDITKVAKTKINKDHKL